MQSQKPVRTYLDPDTVGPLPRCSHADDSDALSAARTIERPPVNTVELAPEDVLEIFDPRRPRQPSSLAPVGYDAAAPALPRRRLGSVVMGVVTVASVIVAIAAVRGSSRSGDQAVSSAAAARSPETAAPGAAPASAVAARTTAALSTLPASEPEEAPQSASAVAAESARIDLAKVGTIRVDPQAEGHRVWVDGLELSADAAIVRCGQHRVKVGSVGQTRTVDVPCGGDITVFR